MIGIGIGIGKSMGGGAATAVAWFLAGDGIAPDIVMDATVADGLTLDGGGAVASILNLGKAADATLTPTDTNSPLVTVAGQVGIQFDGGVDREPYRGAATYAASMFDSTRRMFALQVVTQSVLTGDQTGISAGVTASGSPRFSYRLNTNGTTNSMELHTGTLRSVQGALQRVINTIIAQAFYHDGVNQATLWHNGAVLKLKDAQTTMVTDTAPEMAVITIGALGNGSFDLKGSAIAAAMDNSAALTLDHAFEKYAAAFTQFGVPSKPTLALWSLGQSNAQAEFANADPITFAVGDGFWRQRTGGYSQEFRRDGLEHGSTSVGLSSPAIYFADEWKTLTGQIPVFQELAFSGQPVTPGLTNKTAYWAPRNAEGDAAGDTSLMVTWHDDFLRFSDLLRYSPEFSIQNRVAFILEGEADAVGFTAGDNVTTARLVTFMNAWLDDLKSLYDIQTFAIVNIGRNGADLSAVNANAAGVAVVRAAWSQVIAARADSHDVFPHLNHLPDPFDIDDLVVDADGAWVSGVGFQVDGTHYTTAMYEAIGRTAARNLYAAIG